MTIHIGPISIEDPVFLAPMSGVTDPPYRKMVRKFGAGLVFSEMIASRAVIEEWRGFPKMQDTYADDGIMAVQLAGCDPDVIAEAARINEGRGAQLIDINFGCPAKKVVNSYAGSALMRDEALAAKIMESAVKAVSVPVTVKMRLGWDDDHRNAPNIAKMAEDCGVKMITVHGRTRNQKYSGTADWEAVQRVKDSIKLPVIVNGDITSPEAAKAALAQSGADGVMIGRGSYGKPWLLQQIITHLKTGSTPAAPGFDARAQLICEHYDGLIAHYGAGERQGVAIARKHIGWYAAGLPQSDAFRADVNQMTDPAQVRERIYAYFTGLAG